MDPPAPAQVDPDQPTERAGAEDAPKPPLIDINAPASATRRLGPT
jgi:hypothetical protein